MGTLNANTNVAFVLKRPTTVLNLRGVLVMVSGEKSGIQVVVIPSKSEDTNDDAREFT